MIGKRFDEFIQAVDDLRPNPLGHMVTPERVCYRRDEETMVADVLARAAAATS